MFDFSTEDSSTESLLRIYHRLVKEVSVKFDQLAELNLKTSALQIEKKKLTAENLKLQETANPEISLNSSFIDDSKFEKDEEYLETLKTIVQGNSKINFTNFDMDSKRVEIDWFPDHNSTTKISCVYNTTTNKLENPTTEGAIEEENIQPQIPIGNFLGNKPLSWYESKNNLLNLLHELHENN